MGTAATAPRRAGVSAYGFGGTNFHLVLEEYVPGMLKSEPKVFAAATVSGGQRSSATASVTASATASAPPRWAANQRANP
jgi:acyl transferase domain-containing protein